MWFYCGFERFAHLVGKRWRIVVMTEQWRTIRTIAVIYGIAALFNYVWELAQSLLYVGTALLRNIWWHCGIAAIGDGFLVLIVYTAGWLAFRDAYWFVKPGWRGYLMIMIAGLILSSGIEFVAVNIFKLWAYKPTMPLFPVLGIGLAPVSQMVVLPSLSFRAAAAWH